jgi:hypothetical protein
MAVTKVLKMMTNYERLYQSEEHTFIESSKSLANLKWIGRWATDLYVTEFLRHNCAAQPCRVLPRYDYLQLVSSQWNYTAFAGNQLALSLSMIWVSRQWSPRLSFGMLDICLLARIRLLTCKCQTLPRSYKLLDISWSRCAVTEWTASFRKMDLQVRLSSLIGSLRLIGRYA